MKILSFVAALSLVSITQTTSTILPSEDLREELIANGTQVAKDVLVGIQENIQLQQLRKNAQAMAKLLKAGHLDAEQQILFKEIANLYMAKLKEYLAARKNATPAENNTRKLIETLNRLEELTSNPKRYDFGSMSPIGYCTMPKLDSHQN